MARLPRTLHQHDELAELTLICSGQAVRRIDGHLYHTGAGDVVFYNSGELHDELAGDGGMAQEYYCVGIRHLQFEGLPRNCLLADRLSRVMPSGVYFEPLRQLFAQIYTQAEYGGAEASETAAYLLRALLGQVYRLVREQEQLLAQGEYTLGERVRMYLDEHYRETISLAQVAAAVRANVYYLSHVFKAVSGYAPLQYVTRRRIGEAQNLLIHTQASITDIAAQVGYENSNYFNNVFKTMVGMSPGRYRKKWRDSVGKS